MLNDWRYIADLAAMALLAVSFVELARVHIVPRLRFGRRATEKRITATLAGLLSSGAKRAVIFRAENGGGRPRKGVALYVSAMYGQFAAPFRDIVPEYNRLKVDEQYHDLVNDLISEGELTYLVKDMPRGFLRDIYEAEGVALSQLFYLYENEKAVYYCSVATDEDGLGALSAPAAQVRVRLTVNTLQNLFRQRYE